MPEPEPRSESESRPPSPPPVELEEVPVDEVVAQETGDLETEAVGEPPTSLNGAGLPEEAADVLRQLLSTMGFDAEVTVRSTEDPVMLGITGQNLGVLIGRRGDNLSALQFMVNLILSKNRRQWPRVVVNGWGAAALAPPGFAGVRACSTVAPGALIADSRIAKRQVADVPY